MANQEKQYTFINMKRCIGKNEHPYIGVTMEALVLQPDMRTTESGKKVLNFSTPISNRGKYIGSMCDNAPVEKDGTCWARVAMWEKTAERMDNYLAKHPKCVILLTGAIKVEDTTGKDGKVFRNVNITADDFTILRNLDGSANTKTTSEQKATAASTAESVPSGTNGNFIDISAEDDDDLPF